MNAGIISSATWLFFTLTPLITSCEPLNTWVTACCLSFPISKMRFDTFPNLQGLLWSSSDESNCTGGSGCLKAWCSLVKIQCHCVRWFYFQMYDCQQRCVFDLFPSIFAWEILHAGKSGGLMQQCYYQMFPALQDSSFSQTSKQGTTLDRSPPTLHSPPTDYQFLLHLSFSFKNFFLKSIHYTHLFRAYNYH